MIAKKMFLSIQRTVPVPEEPSANRHRDVPEIILFVRRSQRSRKCCSSTLLC